MEFGYFTLSDNHYPNNPRSANDFVLDIREETILADKLGYHSAWIGEHHFDSLGVNSRPDLLLASIIPETEHIRLAPAVSVLPLHHPVHVAETWATLDLLSGGRVDFAAGRGYDRREYDPFGADFMKSAEYFEDSIEVILKAWGDGPWSHESEFHSIPEMEITPKPVQDPIPFYTASFSNTSLEIAARHGTNVIWAPFAAGMVYGGLDKAVDAYHAECAAAGTTPGRKMCSYFVYIDEDESYGRQTQMDYFKHCALPAFTGDPAKLPPTMQYFLKIIKVLEDMEAKDLSDKSILLGSPQKVIDTLKKVEEDGIDEVILYFNVGRKDKDIVKEQMHLFMDEVAPHFDGKHNARRAMAAAAE